MLPETTDRFALEALQRFYRWNAPIYDWTRPFILWGREAMLHGLEIRKGDHVIDVGCGTGWSFPHLVAKGARVTGVEPSPAMRLRAGARARRLRASSAIAVSERPFGIDERYRGTADRVMFSYSLSMIPPAEAVIEAARASLRSGGRIGVVDFLDASHGVRSWLEVSHVVLGEERLEVLRKAFPRHRLIVRRGVFWRYYLFWSDPSA